MRVLINVPSLKLLGGVANHYLGLSKYWNELVYYNVVGKRWRKGHRFTFLLLPYDVLKFIVKLIVLKTNVVLLNPSLGNRALWRDFLFLRIAKSLKYKVAVFIHGFNWDYAQKANWNWILKHLNKADGVVVLAEAFKKELIKRGIKKPVYLTTTKVDDSLLDGFDISVRDGVVKNILFLSRIERTKGIYEAADTYAILKKRFADMTLTFVGDGSELVALKQYVAEKRIKDVRFTGALSGEALRLEYKNANFFFFASYGEGMPTVVLEAMAFGLPVLTRYVGGLCDFFEDRKMGRITDSKSPLDYAKLMIPYIENRELTKQISIYNHIYACEHFMASSIAKQLEEILRTIGLIGLDTN